MVPTVGFNLIECVFWMVREDRASRSGRTVAVRLSSSLRPIVCVRSVVAGVFYGPPVSLIQMLRWRTDCVRRGVSQFLTARDVGRVVFQRAPAVHFGFCGLDWGFFMASRWDANGAGGGEVVFTVSCWALGHQRKRWSSFLGGNHDAGSERHHCRNRRGSVQPCVTFPAHVADSTTVIGPNSKLHLDMMETSHLFQKIEKSCLNISVQNIYWGVLARALVI